MKNLLEIVSDESDFYNLFLEGDRFETNAEFLVEFLQTDKIPQSVILSESQVEILKELTISDWSRSSAVMPIIKRTSAKRKEIAGEEKVLSKFLGISGKPNSPIINFKTRSTFDTGKHYRTRIQLVNLSKWRQGKYLYNLGTKEFKEILDVCDIKMSCSCPAFHWMGISHYLDQMDSSIDHQPIPAPIWSKRKGYAEISMCKHLRWVLRLVKPNSGKILRVYKDRFSTRFKKSTN
jgi:hypothetical protein